MFAQLEDHAVLCLCQAVIMSCLLTLQVRTGWTALGTGEFCKINDLLSTTEYTRWYQLSGWDITGEGTDWGDR
jgi:hypothetical protein